jgi:hypothetical protein
MRDRRNGSHAARADRHAGGSKRAAGDAGAKIAEVMKMDAGLREVCGRRGTQQVG